MAVVLAHIGVQGANGVYAVICFFVLSGFLITHLLLKEYDKTGDVSLRRFYFRRALRIFPAFYVYAAVYVAVRMIAQMPIDWPFVVARLTYTGNYYSSFGSPELPTMGQTWSLAVEEQFYLLWPLVFWLGARNRTGLMRGLMAVIVAVWAYRPLAVMLHFSEDYIFSAFETRADALAIGCLLAIANRENRIPRWLIDWKWVGVLAVLIVCLSSANQLDGPRYAWAIVALAFAVIILQSIAHSQSGWYRWLEFRPMYALGLISYSLYLYHPFAEHLPGALKIWPVEVAFSIALATGSYLIVEKPFLKLKDRLSRASRQVPVSATR
jgi:peptidoglycan/LPS O-acetylase OafA/YrhL